MRVQVTGRQVDIGEALTQRIMAELEHGVTKYFSSRPADAVVTVSRDGPLFDVECALHLDSGIRLQASGQAGDAHAAFNEALAKIEKQVRRYKRRLKNHQTLPRTELPAETARAYVLARTPDEDDADKEEGRAEEDGESPLVIAESVVHLQTMPVAMAVLQLELGEAACLVFRNAAHGGLNVVFRRPDGHVGWVDPARSNGGPA
jgi:ribosomal subunit interface protein